MDASVVALPVVEPRKLTWRTDLITPVFQPIVAIGPRGHEVVAAEALSRGPSGSSYESPLALFAAARRSGTLARLDRACITSALFAAGRLPKQVSLFLNVHPETLCEDWSFPAFLAGQADRAGIDPARLTLEVLERARVAQSGCLQLRGSLQVLRDFGVRIAVDDVGGEPDDLRRAMALDPHFLKIDAGIVRGADQGGRARAVLHAISEEARHAGVRVIAEGIEDAVTLTAVADAGISLVQGYLLGRPVAAGAFPA